MDPERLPLLNKTESDNKTRRTRVLTLDEVRQYQRRPTWRRARFCVVFIFWAVMAIFLSTVAAMVMNNCTKVDINTLPIVSPAHLSIGKLLSI